VRRRRPDVYDDQIRGVRSYEVKEFLGVSGLTGHGKAGALEKVRQAPRGSTSSSATMTRIRLPEGPSRL
jgi:hypothetical protein